MNSNQQLVKKNRVQGKHSDVFPITYTDLVKDRESEINLTDILSGFNMYFVSYAGTVEDTKIQIPRSLRRMGLWLTFIKDKSVINEWYAGESYDDESWINPTNWREGSNKLVGDITISFKGTWIINGVDTNIPARGEEGITPILRVENNKLQVSYTTGSSWLDLTKEFGKFNISGYVKTVEELPTTTKQGDMFMVGESKPYTLYIYNESGWLDAGEFTSLAVGVSTDLGDNDDIVVSQKTTTDHITEYNLSSFTGGGVNNSYTLEEAVKAVPLELRKVGMKISFVATLKLRDGSFNNTKFAFTTMVYNYTDALEDNWLNLDNWEPVTPIYIEEEDYEFLINKEYFLFFILEAKDE